MRPQVVADIGNSFMKWGLCSSDEARIIEKVSLSDEPAAWEHQLRSWFPAETIDHRDKPLSWAIASAASRRGTTSRRRKDALRTIFCAVVQSNSGSNVSQ